MTKIQINNEITIDHRTHQTHIKLYKALCDSFLNHEEFKTITVKQLCQDSKVGRATFYRHHNNIMDIISVEYLIVIRELGDRLNSLSNANYMAIADATVRTILKHPLLPQLVSWANCRDQIISLEVGMVRQVLMNFQIKQRDLNFISTYTGNCIHQISLQLVSMQPFPHQDYALELFSKLIPNIL